MENKKVLFLYNKQTFMTRCSLGEGLFVKNQQAYWVDINKHLVFGNKLDTFIQYKLKSQPSVIYDFNKDFIYLGADRGLISFSLSTSVEEAIVSGPLDHDYARYRSNDGGYCGEQQLLSFMHREDPETYPGFIYSITGDSYKLIDDTVHIPNTFVPLDSSKILISDSLKSVIWLYEFDNNHELLSKTIWAKLDDNMTPDGGCVVGDFVLIAIWDGASIAVFSMRGELVQELTMPVSRPTNCKFDIKTSKLWVTSATDGLTSEQITEYPESGDTFLFDLRIIN